MRRLRLLLLLTALGLPIAIFGQPKFAEKREAIDSSLQLSIVNSQGQAVGICQVTVHPLGNSQSFWFQTDSLSQVRIPHMLPSEIEVVPQNLAYLNQLFTVQIVPAEGVITLTLTNRDERIDPISITGAVNPQAISKTLYSVEVISSKKIAAMGAQSVDAVLQNQSNINITQDAVLGSGVQLQGMSGADVKILIDGVPMIGRLNGNIDLSQIPTHQIDRIEIVEGPMSVIYGSDAIGGLINIISKKPDQPGLRLDAHAYGNSVGWRNFDASGQWRYKNWGISGFAGRQFSYGYDLDPSTRMMDWRPKTKIFSGAQLQYRADKAEHQWKVQHFYEKLTDRSNAESNLTSVGGYTNYYYTERLDFSHNSLIHLGPNCDLNWQNSANFYNRDKVSYWRNLVTGKESLTGPEDQDTTLNRQLNSRAIIGSRGSHRLNWLTGYEANAENLSSHRIKGLSPLYSVAVFASAEWQIRSWWQIRPSARWSLNNQFGRALSSESNWNISPFIPSIQSKWQISPHLTLRGSAAKAFRAPSLKELYFLFVDINHNIHGNTQLQPELSDNYTATIEYRHSFASGLGAVFKTNWFYNNVDNRIELALLDQRYNYYQYINIGKLQTQGLTPQFEYYGANWSTKLSGTWVRSQIQIDTSSQQQGWNSVQAVWNLEYRWPSPDISANVYTKFNGQQRGFYANGNTYSIEQFSMVDVVLAKTLQWQTGKQIIPISVQLGCNNALGVRRIGAVGLLSTPHNTASQNLNISPGRSLFLALKVTL